MIPPRIKTPLLALTALEMRLERAQRLGHQRVSLSVDSAQEILSFYAQAQRAADFVTTSTYFVPQEGEHVV